METTLSKEASEENVDKALKEFRPNPALQSALAIMPKSFVAVMEMANVFAKSGLVPDALKGKPDACAIAIMHGLELGVSPTQAVNNIMVVNGRPSVWGDLMLAMAIGSGELESFDEDAPDVCLKQGFGRCTGKRNGANNPVTRVFTLEDAKRAGLLTKDTWRNYPGRMLMFRARSWMLRDCIPHVLKGLMMREEVEDYSTGPVPVSMPERVKPPQTTPQGPIHEAEVVVSESGGNAPPAQSSAISRGSEETQPTEETGDGQEPFDPLTDSPLVDENDRKELFKLQMKAKIDTRDIKAYVRDQFKVEDTSKITKGQAKVLADWIAKNARG
jgi:hypothetical protein